MLTTDKQNLLVADIEPSIIHTLQGAGKQTYIPKEEEDIPEVHKVDDQEPDVTDHIERYLSWPSWYVPPPVEGDFGGRPQLEDIPRAHDVGHTGYPLGDALHHEVALTSLDGSLPTGSLMAFLNPFRTRPVEESQGSLESNEHHRRRRSIKSVNLDVVSIPRGVGDEKKGLTKRKMQRMRRQEPELDTILSCEEVYAGISSVPLNETVVSYVSIYCPLVDLCVEIECPVGTTRKPRCTQVENKHWCYMCEYCEWH